MTSKSLFQPILLVSVGLLGITLVPFVLRVSHSALLSNDFVRGLWYGLCLGLEIVGIYRLGKARNTPSS
ncbi:MAG: hypothetical protein ACRD16_01720 [Thermoanaerobaculia bacterium]